MRTQGSSSYQAPPRMKRPVCTMAAALRELPQIQHLFEGRAGEGHLPGQGRVGAGCSLSLRRLDTDPTVRYDAADAKLDAGVQVEGDVGGVDGGGYPSGGRPPVPGTQPARPAGLGFSLSSLYVGSC